MSAKIGSKVFGGTKEARDSQETPGLEYSGSSTHGFEFRRGVKLDNRPWIVAGNQPGNIASLRLIGHSFEFSHECIFTVRYDFFDYLVTEFLFIESIEVLDLAVIREKRYHYASQIGI